MQPAVLGTHTQVVFISLKRLAFILIMDSEGMQAMVIEGKIILLTSTSFLS